MMPPAAWTGSPMTIATVSAPSRRISASTASAHASVQLGSVAHDSQRYRYGAGASTNPSMSGLTCSWYWRRRVAESVP